MTETLHNPGHQPVVQPADTIERSAQLPERAAAGLPEGYWFEHNDAAVPTEELAALMRQVEVGHDITAAQLDAVTERDTSFGYTTIGVGVRDEVGSLVGYGGMRCRGGIADFGDLVVSPEHQSKGIGKALVDERIRLADEMDVNAIEIDLLEPTNTLRSYYFERGFHDDGYGGLVRKRVHSKELGKMVLREPKQPSIQQWYF